jgi:hypothetical protein
MLYKRKTILYNYKYRKQSNNSLKRAGGNNMKQFEGTKIYNDVVELVETGKATFDYVDLTFKLRKQLVKFLKENNLKFTEKQNMFSWYLVDFKLV